MIGNDVWIGRGATILGGIVIGNGEVIGANSTVTKNIPPYAIVVGSPPKIIKYRFNDEIIHKLQAIKWWNWSVEKIIDNLNIMEDPQKFVDEHYNPELEIYPQNEFGDKLRLLKSNGFKIFSSVINEDDPYFVNLINNFSESNLSNAVLILYYFNEIDDDTYTKFQNMIADKNVAMMKFSADAIRESDVFVTTKHFDSMRALDYLQDKIIQIRYFLDDRVFY